MEIKEYGFKYSTSLSAEGTYKRININWDIWDLKKCKSNMKIKTDLKCYAEDLDEDLKFDVMIQYLGQLDDKLIVGFCFSTPVSVELLECNIIQMLSFCGVKWNQTVFNKGPCSVPANEWYLLRSFSLQDVEEYSPVCLEICFVLENPAFFSNADEVMSSSSHTTLTEYLKNMLKDIASSDVTLKSVDGVELPAHKVILSRSAVFKAHFDHGMKESLTNVIETSLKTQVLDELLHYIYTDTAPNLNDMTEELFAAADYYQLDGLKSLCEEALYNELSIENAIQTLVLADTLSAEHLKTLTIEYINDGNIDNVMQTEGWKMIKSPELIKNIFEHKLKK